MCLCVECLCVFESVSVHVSVCVSVCMPLCVVCVCLRVPCAPPG